MAKRLKTYRLEPDECAGFAWAVSITGETETDVIRGAIRAYIQAVRGGTDAPVAPVAEMRVYTVPEWPAGDVEALEDEPGRPACRHPAGLVSETGVCGECGEDVW